MSERDPTLRRSLRSHSRPILEEEHDHAELGEVVDHGVVRVDEAENADPDEDAAEKFPDHRGLAEAHRDLAAHLRPEARAITATQTAKRTPPAPMRNGAAVLPQASVPIARRRIATSEPRPAAIGASVGGAAS